MSRKRKGTNAERELFHMFWSRGWCALRTAGSGSTSMPAPDILASNSERTIAVECKSVKNARKYFYEKEISQLERFASRFGAEPWIGIRFDKEGWFFMPLDKLEKSSGSSFVFTLEFAKDKGFSFEELIGNF